MKVLLINGSPNQKGCTNRALTEVEKSLNENGIKTEIFHIGRKAISGCTACGSCRKTGKCIIEDDCVNTVIAKMEEADGVVIGSPVYYASANGALIALLDRVFYSSGKKFARKLGASVASARRAGTTVTLDEINKYFMISQMPVVSSSYWNMVFGNTVEQVEQDEEGLRIMRDLGKNMAWLLKCTEGKRNLQNI